MIFTKFQVQSCDNCLKVKGMLVLQIRINLYKNTTYKNIVNKEYIEIFFIILSAHTKANKCMPCGKSWQYASEYG